MKTSTPSGGICALLVAVTAAAATPAAKADSATPAYIRPFGLRETRWTEGQWARQQSRCFTRTIPSVRRVIDKPGSRAAFTNFKLLAGLSQEAQGDCRWGDGDVYKYLEALCHDLAVTGDAALDRELDERIGVIARAQQPNGYLHTVNQLATNATPFTVRFDHEDYNLSSKLDLTGGVAAYHRGHSPRGDDVHEAFANAYDLPLAHAYNETCSSFGFAMFCRRLLEATGEARYADWIEQTLFNACLAAVSLDGERFFYSNPLAWHREEQKLLSNDARERWTD